MIRDELEVSSLEVDIQAFRTAQTMVRVSLPIWERPCSALVMVRYANAIGRSLLVVRMCERTAPMQFGEASLSRQTDRLGS